MKSSFKKLMSFLLVTVLMIGCLAIAPVASAASYNIAFSTESKTVNKGDSFTINVNIDSNPGITMLRLYVEYDPSILTLTGAKDNGIMGDYTFDNTYASPFCMVWANGTSNNITATGAVATLTFTASEYGLSNIKVYTESKNDILNSNLDLDTINPTFTNGTVNVVPEGAPVLKFKGAQMLFQENLKFKYSIEKSVLDEYTDPYVVFEMNNVKKTITSYTVENINGVDCCLFSFNDIAPDYMNYTITSTIYGTYNGDLISSVPHNYSAATYCYNRLSKSTNAKFKTLLVDLLNYASALQMYNNNMTDNLVNSSLTSEQVAFGTIVGTVPTVENYMDKNHVVIADPTATFTGARVLVASSIGMEFRFSSKKTLEELTVKVERNGVTTTFSGSNINALTTTPDASGNYSYSIKYRGLNATQMRDMIDVTIYSGGTAISNTLRYSVESYVKSRLDNSTDQIMIALAKALMHYGDSAEAYAATL